MTTLDPKALEAALEAADTAYQDEKYEGLAFDGSIKAAITAYLEAAPSGQAPLAEVKAQRKELRNALKKIDRLETMLSSAEDFAAKCQNERRAAEAAILAPPASGSAEAGWQLVPIKPTDEMSYAAACAHYGKRRVDRSGGIGGITMTVSDQDYTFKAAFKRMWCGALSAAPREGR